MPPTVATNSTAQREYSSRIQNVSTRTSRRPFDSTLASTVTARRSQRTLIENKDANDGPSNGNDLRYKLMNCKVVLQDILAQNYSTKELSRNEKDWSSVIQIDISANNDDIIVVPVQDKEITTDKNSNVTRRTKSRVTRSNDNPNSDIEKQRHTINVVPDDHNSIINLDDSSVSTRRHKRNARNTQSVAEIPDLSVTRKQTQARPTNDVIIQVPNDASSSEEQRTSQNDAAARSATKRKSDSIVPLPESSVSPPKRFCDAPNNTTDLGRVLKNVDNGAFKSLTVLVKRLAPALTAMDLKRLKYPELDSTQDTAVLQRSSIRATKQQSNNVTEERRRRKSTASKPQIVISSPIIEVPESPPSAVENKLLNVSKQSKIVPQSITFKIPQPPKLPPLKQIENKPSNARKPINKAKSISNSLKSPPPSRIPLLPLLIEEENEDVYDFLSSSQNSDTSSINETASKPKQKKVKKPAATTKNKRQKPAAAKKEKVKKQKSNNPFGFNSKALQKVIKNIGGGPVKQPDKVGYKINLEIPKTPPVVAPPATVDLLTDSMELHFDDQQPHLEAARTLIHPAVERLKPVRSQAPLTSTPAHKINPTNSLSVTSIPANPASPWRVQDEMIIPRTSYTPRTKDMMPSYDSFANENENVQLKSAATNVTERRKSPSTSTTVQSAEANVTDASRDEMISDKDIREIEQRYRELRAMSELGEKLITAVRRCEKKGVTPQQDQNIRQARQKLKKWYERSVQAFSIINNIQRTSNGMTERARAAASPLLSQEQQQTVDNFNLSTERFRSMMDDLQLTKNDSDRENRPPARLSKESGKEHIAQSNGKGSNAQSKHPKDVVILPDRGTAATRNPLMPLNVVPLPQRDSPLMSPLAKELPQETNDLENIRRELQYESIGTTMTRTQQHDKAQFNPPAAPSTCSVVEIFDETADNDGSVHHDSDDNDDHSKEEDAQETENPSRDYFGFDDDIGSVVESSVAQVTLPNPLNISNRTLQERLRTVKQLLPNRPFLRAQPKRPMQTRSSGPTRFSAKNLRVFTSPTKRPHTLHDFVASTPGPTTSLRPFVVDAPDVSAIEPISKEANADPDVVLFDTPDRPAWLNNSAHQRTYARVPKLKKKKNIYLANLGLDDDDDEEEDDSVGSDGAQELSSDSETDEEKRMKKKRQKKKPVPVEQTKDFKEFVDNFNSMCEEVERYELIIE